MRDRKKIRGIKHKHVKLKKRITEICAVFPKETGQYWHMHMPCRSSILDSPKVRHKFRQDIAKFLIEQVDYLNSIKPNNPNIRIACFLPFDSLWDAQIIVFFNKEYYESFFSRSDSYQSWTPIELNSAIKSHWSIFNDHNKFRGYHEIINDEEFPFEHDIWFYECL